MPGQPTGQKGREEDAALAGRQFAEDEERRTEEGPGGSARHGHSVRLPGVAEEAHGLEEGQDGQQSEDGGFESHLRCLPPRQDFVEGAQIRDGHRPTHMAPLAAASGLCHLVIQPGMPVPGDLATRTAQAAVPETGDRP